MNCLHCKKRITLIPSAAERARKYGGTPRDYTKLFQYHAECTILLRNQATNDLLRRNHDTKIEGQK